VKVLDPACGSGNFLYVTLQKLKDLEKEAIVYAMDRQLGAYLPMVGPWQMHGIEINPYAFELAQMTIWIGYLQWTRVNGFGITQIPVLKPMDTFVCRDAILDLSDPDHAAEPEWPAVDFIVGNPPFLGGKLLRRELGDTYVNSLFKVWEGRVPREADLCAYWFEAARAHVESGRCHRAGLLATQGIRGGANREVLSKIKQSGGIFFAESDRPWVLDGANVHVSMVGFDDDTDTVRVLDGERVPQINPNLTASVDVTLARSLSGNCGVAFQGPVKVGRFELPPEGAEGYLHEPNPNGRPNSDVLLLWLNGSDLTGRPRWYWIIDFDTKTLAEAAGFQAPFAHLEQHVKPAREKNRDRQRRENWWRLGRSGAEWKAASSQIARALFTPRVAKHRVFAWVEGSTFPDSAVVAFATEADYFFGALHSRSHEVWALCLGTRLETRPRYTPSTCFETFPFPETSDAQREAIAEAARELDRLRSNWLNPPEWTREEVLEFPGSVDGPWSRYVHDPDSRGIGTVRYPRIVPRDEGCAQRLKPRTLTNLYNERPTWLDLAHRRLDEAVFAAYGWPTDLADGEILERLLRLNLERATRERA
jgi:type II restriction/modification system DNA methylase subunit YeeA